SATIFSCPMFRASEMILPVLKYPILLLQECCLSLLCICFLSCLCILTLNLIFVVSDCNINSCRYVIDCQLSEGGFGTVYAATRLDDGQKDGCSKPLPLEVALQILANEGPRVEEIIQLLDWRVESDHYILVLERPVPFEELNWFLLQQMVTIQEDVARIIMCQATSAAQTCCRLKLTNFGCGEFLNGVGYTSFAGTREFCPPEYHMTGTYHGEPATVWSLGILLFLMLCGEFPNTRDLRLIDGKNWTKDGLSEECSDFICCCLQINPKERIELEKLSLHDWFMVSTFE
uniref:non-specific serine/threonine protein kinase n=1 Tax=Cyprinus carpio carpio TaxID=630221 RepID=A0A8C1BUR3_CYPCA